MKIETSQKGKERCVSFLVGGKRGRKRPSLHLTVLIQEEKRKLRVQFHRILRGA